MLVSVPRYPESVEFLRANGITVHAEQTLDAARHTALLKRVLAAKPQLLLDNGGDLFALYLSDPYPGLIGGTEDFNSSVDGDGNGSDNRDRAYGDNGDDVFIWAPGDGSD